MNSYSKNSENINYKNISSDLPKSGSFVSEPLASVGSHAPPLPSMAPPLPPRPNSNTNDRYLNLMNRQTAMNPYMNPAFSGMGSTFFNPMQAFNTFGSYGLNGMNRFNNYATNDDEFSRLAEDSSRHVFQSIESIVGAFSSVSMMLESTYFAVHNSFRAVVAVVDQLSGVRNHLTQIVSTLSILRTLRWILNRLLRIVGLNRYITGNTESCDSVSSDKAWTDANSHHLINHLGMHLNSDGTLNSQQSNDITQHSSWPIIIFFSLVVGMPWLLWKIISKFNYTNKSVSNNWMNGDGEHYRAITLYDFQAESPRELSFKTGQHLTIAPKDLQPRVRGWLLASNYSKKVGLIPANYVKINSYLKSNENYQNK